MLTNPILQFISDLRKNGKIPEVFPEALAEAITFTGNLDVAHYEDPGYTALGFAAAKGDLTLVKALIDLGASPQKLNGDYQTLLHMAASQSILELLEFALNTMSPEMIALTNYNGNNVFHFACTKGDSQVIAFLLKDPRVKSLIYQKNLFGMTPLDIAISKGNDEAIHLLNPNINISTLTEYGKSSPNLSQDHLESQLTKYLSLTGRAELSEGVINKFGMCQGWSWLRQIYLTQGKEDEYLALINLIATWDGTEQGLQSHDLPNILKDKYQKIFPNNRKEPGDVAFVFENFVNGLNIAFAHTEIFKEFDLGILQNDRLKQYELLRSPTDKRILKNGFNIPYNIYNKAQLIEVLEFIAKWPGMSIDIMRRGHAVTLNVTPEGLLDYYDSGLESRIDHVMSPAELADHLIKTDQTIDAEFRAFKFYPANKPIPEIEVPVLRGAPQAASPNGYTPLHLAILENNPQKLMDLLKTGAYDIKALDAHGFTPLKLALRANLPECALCLLSHNQAKPVTHSDELDFKKISLDPYALDMVTFKSYVDTNALTFDECLLIKKLMQQGDLSFDLTDKHGNTLASTNFFQNNRDNYQTDHRFRELVDFIDSPKVIATPNEPMAIESQPRINLIKEFYLAIQNLDIHGIETLLASMTENEKAVINHFYEHGESLINEGIAWPFYDQAINSTIKRFLETGDVSLVKQCVDILHLFKAKGWDGIIYNGIIEKAFNFQVFNQPPYDSLNVTDFPHFNAKTYDEFASLLTKTLQEQFATWEESSFEKYMNNLEKQVQEIHEKQMQEPQDRRDTHYLEHLQMQLHHVKTIALQREERKRLWGRDFLADVDLPDATPGKDTFVFLINNLSDGVGDAVHGLDIARHSREYLKSKGYKLHALVKLVHSEPGTSQVYARDPQNKRRDYVLSMLNGKDSPFDDFVVNDSIEDDSSLYQLDIAQAQEQQWQQEHQAELDRLLSGTVGGLEISCPFGDTAYLPNVNFTQCFEYGFNNPVSGMQGAVDNFQYPSLSNAQMGLVNSSDNPNISGIKIIDNPVTDANRANKLITLAAYENKFVRQLLAKDSDPLVEKDAQEYFANHNLFPGYLQTSHGACSFVVIHALRYQDESKVCDFILPKASVDNKMIIEQLILQGVIKDASEVAFIDNNSPVTSNPNVKIRIFTNRIEKDEDYNLLYFLSDKGAGCSGDNSVTNVFSSDNPPFFEYKNGPIGHFFKSQLIQLIDNFIDQQKNNNSPENVQVIADLEVLKQYFSHLCTFNPNTNSPDKDFILQANHALDRDALSRAWKIVGAHIRKDNFYDNLPTIIKSNILFNTLSEEKMRAKFYPEGKLVQLSDSSQLPTQTSVHLEPLRSLLEQDFITPELIRQIIPDIDTKKSLHYQEKLAIDEIRRRLQPLLRLPPDQRQKVFETPYLIQVMLFELITPDNLKELLNSDKKDYDSLLAQYINFDSAVNLAFTLDLSAQQLYPMLSRLLAHINFHAEHKHIIESIYRRNYDLTIILLNRADFNQFPDGGFAIVKEALLLPFSYSRGVLTLLRDKGAKMDSSLLLDFLNRCYLAQYHPTIYLKNLEFILMNADYDQQILEQAIELASTKNYALLKNALIAHKNKIQPPSRAKSIVSSYAQQSSAKKQPLTDDQREKLLPLLLAYCAELKTVPTKIIPENLPESLKEISFSIFVDKNKVPYALFEGKDQAFKRETDANDKVISQVKKGQSLVDGKYMVVKITSVPPDESLRSAWIKVIENENSLAQAAGLNATSGFVGNKHYQFMEQAEGMPLKQPPPTNTDDSPLMAQRLNTERFSTTALTMSQKIDITSKILQKLQDLHCNKHILHRDLYGDNIIVAREGDHFKVRLIDFGLSVRMNADNTYSGSTGDAVWGEIEMLKMGLLASQSQESTLQTPKVDVEKVIETIIYGLDIDDPAVISALENFKQNNNFTAASYDQLIHDINQLKQPSVTLQK